MRNTQADDLPYKGEKSGAIADAHCHGKDELRVVSISSLVDIGSTCMMNRNAANETEPLRR